MVLQTVLPIAYRPIRALHDVVHSSVDFLTVIPAVLSGRVFLSAVKKISRRVELSLGALNVRFAPKSDRSIGAHSANRTPSKIAPISLRRCLLGKRTKLDTAFLRFCSISRCTPRAQWPLN